MYIELIFMIFEFTVAFLLRLNFYNLIVFEFYLENFFFFEYLFDKTLDRK